MNSMTSKEAIIEYLLKKGITAVGFTNGNPLLEYAFFIEEKHRDKAVYFEPSFQKTLTDTSWYTPSDHLSGVKSIITILLPYHLGLTRGEKKPELALSKASIFSDYHKMLEIQLESLSEFIQKTYHKNSIYYCDTGPLNDKAVLLKTGTVKLLRNSLLYHHNYGSRFYIGYLLTELELDTNEIKEFDKCLREYIPLELDAYKHKSLSIESLFHPFCSQCGRCMAACPNKAIQTHGHLDSKRCISFLTQSNEWDRLGEDLTLNGYVYGCDICQLVCPLNGKDLSKSYGYDKVVSEEVSLEALEQMTNREFKNIYQSSSAGWIGKKRFIRNAKQILGGN